MLCYFQPLEEVNSDLRDYHKQELPTEKDVNPLEFVSVKLENNGGQVSLDKINTTIIYGVVIFT